MRFDTAYADWRSGQLTREEAARLLNVHERTFRRYVDRYHEDGQQGLHWHTVRSIDYQRLREELQEPDRRQIRRLIMDEFALFKGHRYATVVIDADTQQVLWLGEGRSREAIRPFFEWLGPEACDRIEAVPACSNG